ncbi:MAG TPA: 2-C-methyl-D-erythritol 4-phosphate cytidylyltransferase, partial [Pyrinomonadaceae bacterium]|nr:2-C-methyl-D-erythritol 4-phosphate cytidylyltransferase [Pyrinomonadaceae bacterium]
DIVAVHDAVRPFVTVEEIERTVAAAQQKGAAILARAPVDTVKQVANGQVTKTLSRNDLRLALTPQCFRYSLLRSAYEKVDVNDPALTDESSLIERLGIGVAIVEGSERNIKITTPADLAFAEQLLRS